MLICATARNSLLLGIEKRSTVEYTYNKNACNEKLDITRTTIGPDRFLLFSYLEIPCYNEVNRRRQGLKSDIASSDSWNQVVITTLNRKIKTRFWNQHLILGYARRQCVLPDFLRQQWPPLELRTEFKGRHPRRLSTWRTRAHVRNCQVGNDFVAIESHRD